MTAFQFFPSRGIALYMVKGFILRVIAVLAMLVIILQTLDLLGESGNILEVAGNTDADVWRYVGMRAPQLVATFLPYAVLLGAILLFATLNQNSEVISMKAAGLSAHQVLAPMIVASLGIAVLSFTFNDTVVAPASSRLDAWKRNGYVKLPPDTGLIANVWTRDGDDHVRIGLVRAARSPALLEDVDIYVRQDNRLDAIISGARALPLPGGGWRMTDVRRFDIADARVSRLPRIDFGRGIDVASLRLTNVDPDALDFMALSRTIDELDAAGRRTAELRANLHHKISGPLSAALMPLLGAVAAFGLARSGQLFVRAVTGMALGFAYFVADNFALAMGSLGAYDPLLAAWGPFLLFFLIGETVLVRTEE